GYLQARLHAGPDLTSPVRFDVESIIVPDRKRADIYIACFHSQPGQDLRGASGQFETVEKATQAGEWPYDNGDDPSFYQARQGNPLTWGVCRQNVRNAIQPKDIVVFIS